MFMLVFSLLHKVYGEFREIVQLCDNFGPEFNLYIIHGSGSQLDLLQDFILSLYLTRRGNTEHQNCISCKTFF